MATRFIFFSLFVPFIMEAQPITIAQQKALNHYVEYANKSGEETKLLVDRMRSYYTDLQRYRIHKSNQALRFSYGFQLEEYFYVTAQKGVVGVDDAMLRSKLSAVRQAAEEMDVLAKQLDTYHKLEDYKTDEYRKAEELIKSFQTRLKEYVAKRRDLYETVCTVYAKLQTQKTGAYANTVKQLTDRITHETALLNAWTLNLNARVHTGWPVETVKQHILTTQELIDKKVSSTGIQYPASSMISSFEDGLLMMQQIKRAGLDRYTHEAQQSDEHSNAVYLDLINVYNGVLVSFYNSFVGYAQSDYKALLALTYVPVVEIRTQVVTVEVRAKPFTDIPHTPLALTAQRMPITALTFQALTLYVDYINECVRQTDRLQRLYANLYGSTHSYRKLTSYAGKGGLSFNLSDFEIPVSLHQQVLSTSKSIPDSYRKSLNDQAEVLLRILTEMNALSVELATETSQRKYEKDDLNKVDELIQRYKVITDLFHDKKEVLYADVRKVFESFPLHESTNAGNVAGKALLKVIDADKTELDNAKLFYLGYETQKPDPEKIQKLIRTVVTDEYENLKGIEKLGRYNGNCPYTPYEDIATDSKKFTEPAFKPATGSPLSYSHPYHNYVYAFNSVVSSYNKFCELAKVPVLKTIHEPELFVLDNPPVKPKDNQTNVQPQPTVRPQANNPTSEEQPTTPQNKLYRDTVYIEKRDTVWLDREMDGSRSMEGYATNNMVLLLDVSGSMNRTDRLPLLKASVLQLLEMMREEDELSLVVFSGKPEVLLQPISFKEQGKIKKAIGKLQSSGTTDGNAALALAYEVADKNYIRGGNNRIILATDGEFPVSPQTQALIERFAKEDIFLTVFNFGAGTGSVKMLGKIAALGKGNYEPVTKDDVERKLVREAKSKRKK
jgi:Ca-activated chloride channel homolog